MPPSLNAILEDWIEKNTIHCPVGKITTRMCEELRKRPSIGDNAAWGYCGMKKLNAKPTVCESCDGWQGFVRQVDWGEEMKPEAESTCTNDDNDAGQEFQFTCEKHGPHNGGMIGVAFSKKCPLCVNELRKAKNKERQNMKRLEDASKVVAETKAALGIVQQQPIQSSVPTLEQAIQIVNGHDQDTNTVNSAPIPEVVSRLEKIDNSPALVVTIDFNNCPWLLEFIKSQSSLPVSLIIKRHFLEMMDPKDAKTVLMTQII